MTEFISDLKAMAKVTSAILLLRKGGKHSLDERLKRKDDIMVERLYLVDGDR